MNSESDQTRPSAKQQTSNGKRIIIAKAEKPAARLVPLRETGQKIRFGLMQGEVKIAKDFDAPCPKTH